MFSNGKSQPESLEDISRSTRSGVLALQTISRNLKTALINRGLILGLALLAIDALIVSDFQPQVALAVLRESPWMAVLVGTLLNLLPVIVPVVGTSLLVFGAMKLCSREGFDGIVKLGQSFFVFAVAWLTLDRNLVWSPNVMIPVFGGVFILGIVVGYRWGYSSATEEFTGMIMILTFLCAIGIALANSAVSGALTRPYASAEVFTIQSAGKQTEQVVGYALSVDSSGQWTTILTEEGGHIEHVSSQSVLAREICEPGPRAQFTPWWTLFVRGVDFSNDQSLTQIPTQRGQSMMQTCIEN